MKILNTNRLTNPANETSKTERNSTIKIPPVSETAGAKQHIHNSKRLEETLVSPTRRLNTGELVGCIIFNVPI